MNRDIMLTAIGDLDPAMVEDAYMARPRRGGLPGRFIAAAACLVLVAAGATALWPRDTDTPDSSGPYPAEGGGVTIPEMEISLSAGGADDMMECVVYNGHVYGYLDTDSAVTLSDYPELVGERLGAATGLIDEWTPREGYVELAGTFIGDIFAVNGFPTDFMVCRVAGGKIHFLVNDHGLTVRSGAEIFEDRWGISANLESVTWQDYESWKHSAGGVTEVPDLDAVRPLIEALDAAEPEVYTVTNDLTPLYRLYLHTAQGPTMTLVVYPNGWVRAPSFWSLAFQVDPALMQGLAEG